MALSMNRPRFLTRALAAVAGLLSRFPMPAKSRVPAPAIGRTGAHGRTSRTQYVHFRGPAQYKFDAGNLYGWALQDAREHPELVEKFRRSRGSQRMLVIRRNAGAAA